MKQNLPSVAGFWYGSDLSWLETLCIQSFLDHGHHFVLYLPQMIKGVPEGAEVRSASEIFWPPPFSLEEKERHKVAVFSDLFRLHLCQQTDFIWVDLDAFCVKPFDFDTPWVFGDCRDGLIPNGVLGLPKGSETLALMSDFVMSPNPTQPWRGKRLKRLNRRRIDAGETWGIESLPWGCSGPKALNHFLHQTGEDKHALGPDALYPLVPGELWRLHIPSVATADIEREGVYSVHIYGHQKKEMANKLSGLPKPNSYLDRICRRHSIDPTANPIVRLNWMKQIAE
ncbi:MAG: hypothetical protein ACR2O2_14725 [Ruegeria sp.]